MKHKLVHLIDTAFLLLLTAFAWALAGWILAVPVLAAGVLVMRRARKLPADTPEEIEEGRRRTYAQFQKDLHDPTGGAGISLLRDVD